MAVFQEKLGREKVLNLPSILEGAHVLEKYSRVLNAYTCFSEEKGLHGIESLAKK